MAFLRVSVNRLRKGMVIASDVYANTGVILVPAGTTVTKEVIHLLTRHFVETVMVEYIVEKKDPSVEVQEEPVREEEHKISEEEHRIFQEKFRVAEDSIAHTLMAVVNGDQEIEVATLLDTINDVIAKSDGETGLISMLMRMKQTSASLYQHAMNVAMFGQILARWMRCSKEEIELVAVAGLLHDIGLTNLSKERRLIFSPKTALENEDKGRHAIDGFNLIKSQNIDGRVKQAVLTHHERLDGSGYPLQAMFSDINRISRIIAIADVYDLLTMKENGQEALSVFSALGKMENMGDNKLDSQMLMRFMTNIAESMIQHQVLLNTGQIGKVIMVDKYNVSRPLVQVENTFIDMAKVKDIYIKEVLD